jgi:hypothetical protein
VKRFTARVLQHSMNVHSVGVQGVGVQGVGVQGVGVQGVCINCKSLRGINTSDRSRALLVGCE